MAKYQKGQLKSVQLLVQMQHFKDFDQQMKFFLLGVMVLFDYFNGRVYAEADYDYPNPKIASKMFYL